MIDDDVVTRTSRSRSRSSRPRTERRWWAENAFIWRRARAHARVMTARDSRPSALENLAAAENSAPPSPLALTSSAGAVATFRSAEAAAPANRLAHVSERFARFYSDLENEKASRREVETGRRNALYDQVQRLELELENETKRRADADEETRRAIERELKNFERAAETRVQDALAGVKSTLDTLASSLAELHAGLREEREQRRVDVEHLASSVVAKVDECASAVDDERVDRLRREAATLRCVLSHTGPRTVRPRRRGARRSLRTFPGARISPLIPPSLSIPTHLDAFQLRPTPSDSLVPTFARTERVSDASARTCCGCRRRWTASGASARLLSRTSRARWRSCGARSEGTRTPSTSSRWARSPR